MPKSQTIFDQTFLLTRAKLIEIAATLDRIDRAEGALDDPRRARITEALEVLLDADEPDRAAKLQQIFSRPYDPEWRKQFGI